MSAIAIAKVRFVVAALTVTMSLVGAAHAQKAPTFTTGLAQTTVSNIYECQQSRARPSPVGSIRSDDGSKWVVPAKTNFQTAMKAVDLYNDCDGIQLRQLSDLDIKTVPIVDAGGEQVFTAFIFADNYFEFYVNGKLIAVDAIPFSPFNSSVIRFKATRPFTIAAMGVDWEENPGLGSERNRGVTYHPGDAGFVAVVRDDNERVVAITDKSWLAQTFYTAPLHDRSCLKVRGAVRDSSDCSTDSVRDGRSFSAAHWQVPATWFSPDFDDSGWPRAKVFTNEVVGVGNKPAFMNFTDVFDDPAADADFIWSSNLVLDNLVLMRRTVQ